MTTQPLRASDRAINLITTFESFAARAYTCPAGKLTIGYGHVILKREPELARMEISQADAREILRRDVALVETYLNDVLPDSPRQHHFDAMSSLAFNIGVAALDRSTLLKKVKAGDMQGAADEFEKWVYSGGKRLYGLYVRRICERLLFIGMTDATITNERARLQAVRLKSW